jgi:hypothetical protein
MAASRKGRRRPKAPPPVTIEVEAVRDYGSRFGSRGKGARFFYDYEGDPHGLRAKGLVQPYAAPAETPA